MAKSLIGFDIEGLPQLQNKLKHLPQDVKDAVGDDIAKYLLNVVRAYPPQKSVTRKQAYGTTFFSDKQRRWFFWALKNGALDVPYKRTQAFSRSWRIIGKGTDTIVVNETDYGGYLMGPGEQSRMSKIIGWKTTEQVLDERAERIDRIADAALKKALNKR